MIGTTAAALATAVAISIHALGVADMQRRVGLELNDAGHRQDAAIFRAADELGKRVEFARADCAKRRRKLGVFHREHSEKQDWAVLCVAEVANVRHMGAAAPVEVA